MLFSLSVSLLSTLEREKAEVVERTFNASRGRSEQVRLHRETLSQWENKNNTKLGEVTHTFSPHSGGRQRQANL